MNAFFGAEDSGDDEQKRRKRPRLTHSPSPPASPRTAAEAPADDASEDPLDAFMSTLQPDAPRTPPPALASELAPVDAADSFLAAHAAAQAEAAAREAEAVAHQAAARARSLPPVRKRLVAASAASAGSEAVARVRARVAAGVKVERAVPCAPLRAFDASAAIDRRVVRALARRGVREPTPIQRELIPVALFGADVIGVAPTGSGKSIAFLVPLIAHVLEQAPLAEGETGPLALVLVPTHELAEQIFVVASQLCENIGLRGVAMYGGNAMQQQRVSLKHGVEFAIATPGRLHDHVSKRNCSLARCGFLVLDEADRMLSMGFRHQVMDIVKHVRPRGTRQTLLLSATLNKKVDRLIHDVLQDPTRITVGAQEGEMNEKVLQIVEVLRGKPAKLQWLEQRLERFVADGQVLVFVATKKEAAWLGRQLTRDVRALRIDALHGDLPGPARTEILNKFRRNQLQVLVATDVAARGLDLPDVRTVICYEAPKDLDTHTHRIGRVSRGVGEETFLGQAYTLLDAENMHDSKTANILIGALRQAKQEVSNELLQLASQASDRVQAETSAYNPLMGT